MAKFMEARRLYMVVLLYLYCVCISLEASAGGNSDLEPSIHDTISELLENQESDNTRTKRTSTDEQDARLNELKKLLIDRLKSDKASDGSSERDSLHEKNINEQNNKMNSDRLYRFLLEEKRAADGQAVPLRQQLKVRRAIRQWLANKQSFSTEKDSGKSIESDDRAADLKTRLIQLLARRKQTDDKQESISRNARNVLESLLAGHDDTAAVAEEKKNEKSDAARNVLQIWLSNAGEATKVGKQQSDRQHVVAHKDRERRLIRSLLAQLGGKTDKTLESGADKVLQSESALHKLRRNTNDLLEELLVINKNNEASRQRDARSALRELFAEADDNKEFLGRKKGSENSHAGATANQDSQGNTNLDSDRTSKLQDGNNDEVLHQLLDLLDNRQRRHSGSTENKDEANDRKLNQIHSVWNHFIDASNNFWNGQPHGNVAGNKKSRRDTNEKQLPTVNYPIRQKYDPRIDSIGEDIIEACNLPVADVKKGLTGDKDAKKRIERAIWKCTMS